MEIKIKGQVKNTFFSQEKNKTYVSVFDSQSSSDVNFTIEGQTDLHKGSEINHVLQVESTVFKGMNTLVIRRMDAQKP